MGKKYLMDSNVIIDLSHNRFSSEITKSLSQIIDKSFDISVISYIELLGFDSDKDYLKNMQSMLALSEMHNLDKAIIETTIQLRKKYKIKLPDAIIAATAIAQQFTLITSDIKDFKKIKELNAIQPKALV